MGLFQEVGNLEKERETNGGVEGGAIGYRFIQEREKNKKVKA